MQTNTFTPMHTATVDILMMNSCYQAVKYAEFKNDVPQPEDLKAWYEDPLTKKAVSSMIAICLNTAAKKRKKLQLN